MLGDFFGDIVGAHYEFDPIKNYDFQLLHEDFRRLKLPEPEQPAGRPEEARRGFRIISCGAFVI